MSKIIFIAFTLFSLNSLANLTGHWSGSGKVTDSMEKTFPCEKLEVNVAHESNSFEIKQARFACDALAMDWQLPTLEIKEKQIFYQGKKIGKTSDTRVEFEINFNGYIQRIDMSLESGNLIYREFWVNQATNSYIMSFAGELQKQLTF